MSWCRPSSGCLSTVVQIVTHVACLITFSTCVALAVYLRVFVNVVSVKLYIGMIYINVGEMWFIPMNVYNELFNGVRQLRWQHLSPVVSTFSTSIRLLSFFFLKHCILPPSSLSVPSTPLYMSLFLHPVFVISGLSLRFRDVDQCFLLAIQSSLQKDTFTIQ